MGLLDMVSGMMQNEDRTPLTEQEKTFQMKLLIFFQKNYRKLGTAKLVNIQKTEQGELILSLKFPPDVLNSWITVFPEHKEAIKTLGGELDAR